MPAEVELRYELAEMVREEYGPEQLARGSPRR